MSKIRYVARPTAVSNGESSIDLYKGDVLINTVLSGIKPQRLAREVAAELNEAFFLGHKAARDELGP